VGRKLALSEAEGVAELRYLPFGQTRWMSGTTPTDRRFTGQREVPAIGLYDYNARMYWPAAGRFVSADTVVPGPGNPQAFNRYSYVLNNPLRLIDTDGHSAQDPAKQQEEFKAKITKALKKSKIWTEMLRKAPRLLDKIAFVFSPAASGMNPPARGGTYLIELDENYANKSGLAPKEAAVIAHEVFHVFQREMAARNGSPSDIRNTKNADGDSFFWTNYPFEREATIFQFSVLAELVGIPEFRNDALYRPERTALAALQGSEADANAWLMRQSPTLGSVNIYDFANRLQPDSARTGKSWDQLMTDFNYRFSRTALNVMRQAGGLPVQ
jgi:RHS repeat-associated protein